MKVEIADLNKVIKANDLKEITNPVYFEYMGVPTNDGLFSFEIFGRPGSEDRKTIFAYIDLIDWYLHPLIYKSLIRLNRKFEKCIAAIGLFKLDEKGILVEASEEEEGNKGVGSGLKWLYSNWEKINFKKTASQDRIERLKLLTIDKNSAWQNKELVIPAFYRDINFEKAQMNIIGRDEINEKYAHLLRLINNAKFNKLYNDESSDTEDPMYNNSRMIIQKLLNDIYDYFTQKLEKKNGMFHQGLLGKSIDYAGISVISSPKIDQEYYTQMPVSSSKLGVPLAELASLFYPFFLKWLTDFFRNKFLEFPDIDIMKLDNNELKYKERVLLDVEKSMSLYTEMEIYKRIKSFMKAPSSRFDPIYAYVQNIKDPIKLRFVGHLANPRLGKYDSDIYERDLTWTDVLYMAAEDICKDKHIYTTRYPVATSLSIYPVGITVNSTVKVCSMTIDGKTYDRYPVIDLKTKPEEIESKFIDTLVVFNGHLAALNGDYDGDTMVLRGLFTQEANLEAERMINSKAMLLNSTGANVRTTTNEALFCLYSLTMDPPTNGKL